MGEEARGGEGKVKAMKPIQIELIPGDNIHDVLELAVSKAGAEARSVSFTFNDHEFSVSPDETLGDVKARWHAKTGIKPITRTEAAEEASQWLEKMQREQADAIRNAGVMTEAQLREFDPPWPKSMAELTDFIKSVTDRPHDYGTCVYAMSLAATAAFHFVASQVGASGFQASCADMDIIRRTRHYRHGFRITDYGNLLYPQYLNDERIPGWQSLLNGDARDELRKVAKEKLAEGGAASPAVLAHWQRIVSDERF